MSLATEKMFLNTSDGKRTASLSQFCVYMSPSFLWKSW
jgi:hypothetical protein